jgi:hypothetical protein
MLAAVSADITIFTVGSYPASIDDVAQASPGTLVALTTAPHSPNTSRAHCSVFKRPISDRLCILSRFAPFAIGALRAPFLADPAMRFIVVLQKRTIVLLYSML